MRPGLVFLGLFALLLVVYALLADRLGTVPTFVLQAAIVLVILGAAIWFRRLRETRGWHQPRGTADGATAGSSATSPAEEEDREVPKVR